MKRRLTGLSEVCLDTLSWRITNPLTSSNTVLAVRTESSPEAGPLNSIPKTNFWSQGGRIYLAAHMPASIIARCFSGSSGGGHGLASLDPASDSRSRSDTVLDGHLVTCTPQGAHHLFHLQICERCLDSPHLQEHQ